MNEKITHGLLVDDFKANIIKLINSHPLDIQTKTLILENIFISTRAEAIEQTKKELAEYRSLQEANNESGL